MRLEFYTRTMLDDRGQRREVYSSRGRAWSRRERQRIADVDFQEMRQALGARDGAFRVMMLLSLLVLAVGLSSSEAGGFLDARALIVLGAFAVMTLYSVILNRFELPTRDGDRIRRTLITMSRCPSCASVLPGTPQADGCFLCAHCGGAWRPVVTGDHCTCGYDLVGLSPNDSGRIQCPECGRSFSATKAWAERFVGGATNTIPPPTGHCRPPERAAR
jgi:hypothetical protein